MNLTTDHWRITNASLNRADDHQYRLRKPHEEIHQAESPLGYLSIDCVKGVTGGYAAYAAIRIQQNSTTSLVLPSVTRLSPITTGVHKLNIMYNIIDEYDNSLDTNGEPTYQSSTIGIVVGGVTFTPDGFIGGYGADFSWLLDGKRQTRFPYDRGIRGYRKYDVVKPHRRWKDGDLITITVDADKKSIVFAKSGENPIVLRNVLRFTNTLMHVPINLFYYGRGSGYKGHEAEALTIVG